MHYLWDKLVLDAESRIEKKIHIFFTSFFFTAASMNPVNINNIAETRKNALTVAIFRLQVRGLKKQFYWLMLQTVYPMRIFDTSLRGALFSRVREHLYKVFVKVFIFVKTVLHKN